MASIRDIHTPWRDALLPAMFDGCPFQVEAGAMAGGRRTVVHEFPKRDTPYAEDMGRKATEFQVRGYCVSFMYDANEPPGTALSMSPLYMRDYRIARDMLQQRLDAGGSGVLQLPNSARATTAPIRVPQPNNNLTISVVCVGYRMTEEQRFGGYASFDMQFVEFGTGPSPAQPSTMVQLTLQANNLYSYVVQTIANGVPAEV
jgi:hypothetical protein